MSTVLTKEVIVDVIAKSKATSISGIWKALGHSSAISGGQGKKIRELVPNHLELFKANKNGVIPAEKTVQPQTTPALVAKATKAPKITKVKGAGGFRDGSGYASLFAEGSKGYTTKAELLGKVAKLTGKTEVQVAFAYGVMGSIDHPSNKKRAMLDRNTVAGKVKVVPYDEAIYQAWEKADKVKKA